MFANYAPFADRMIKRYEGGYCWDKADPGGPTKYGITCYDLAEHRKQKMHSMSAWAPLVRDMTLAEAEEIYKKKYATGIRFDDLPSGIDVAMFDYGVNSGVARPVRVARVILGLGAGGMDQVLVDKLKTVDAKAFVNKLCDERLNFMHAIRGGSAWAQFGHGWGSRVADLRSYAGGLTVGVTAPHDDGPDLTHVVQPKAKHVATSAGKPTAGGAGGAAVAVHQLGYGWEWIIGAAVLVVAAGIAFEIYQQHKTDAANNLVHL